MAEPRQHNISGNILENNIKFRIHVVEQLWANQKIQKINNNKPKS